MRVLIAPKAFQDGPRAGRVADAIADGVEQAQSDAIIDRLPLADGGDGTLDVVATLLDADVEVLQVADLYGRTTTAHLGLTSQGIAVLEMTHAAGATDVNPTEDDPLHASTFGVGELIKHALDRGARQILLGAGGSGTIDAGAGALAALGATFHDVGGQQLNPTPHGLERLMTIDLDDMDPRLAEVSLVILSDTTVPLMENLHVYGARKGVKSETAPRLAAAIENVGRLAAAEGFEILESAWVGAGGGLAGGLHAFAGAKVIPGARFVMRLAEFDKCLLTADHVFTAGGHLDRDTFLGKVPYVVATAAAHRGVPATVIAEAATGPLPPLPANCGYVVLGKPEGDGITTLRSLSRAAARRLSGTT